MKRRRIHKYRDYGPDDYLVVLLALGPPFCFDGLTPLEAMRARVNYANEARRILGEDGSCQYTNFAMGEYESWYRSIERYGADYKVNKEREKLRSALHIRTVDLWPATTVGGQDMGEVQGDEGSMGRD